MSAGAGVKSPTTIVDKVEPFLRMKRVGSQGRPRSSKGITPLSWVVVTVSLSLKAARIPHCLGFSRMLQLADRDRINASSNLPTNLSLNPFKLPLNNLKPTSLPGNSDPLPKGRFSLIPRLLQGKSVEERSEYRPGSYWISSRLDNAINVLLRLGHRTSGREKTLPWCSTEVVKAGMGPPVWQGWLNWTPVPSLVSSH